VWYNLILILHIIVCIELIIVVLLQVGKTNALSGIFGGSSQTVFGAQSGNILTKITTFSAIVFMITSVLLTVVPSGKSVIKDTFKEQQSVVQPQQSAAPEQKQEQSAQQGGAVQKEQQQPVSEQQ